MAAPAPALIRQRFGVKLETSLVCSLCPGVVGTCLAEVNQIGLCACLRERNPPPRLCLRPGSDAGAGADPSRPRLGEMSGESLTA